MVDFPTNYLYIYLNKIEMQFIWIKNYFGAKYYFTKQQKYKNNYL